MILFFLFVREVIRFAALLPVAFYFRNGSRILVFVSRERCSHGRVSFANRLLRYIPWQGGKERKRGRVRPARVLLE